MVLDAALSARLLHFNGAEAAAAPDQSAALEQQHERRLAIGLSRFAVER
jgi:hypothetical protein